MFIKYISIVCLLLMATPVQSNDILPPLNISPSQQEIEDAASQSGLAYLGSCMWRGMGDAAVQGDYAYLAMNNGLMILDISNPASPVQVSQLFMQLMWAWSIEVSGDYAYLIDYYGLKIIDISDPGAPFLTDACNTPNHMAYDIALAGDHAIVAQKQNGIQVIEIFRPYQPTLRGSHDTPGDARSVVVIENLAYVADYAGGLQIFDISNPFVPDSIGALNTIGYSRDVDVSGDYAYLACGPAGLRIINISDPENPALSQTFPTPGSADYLMLDDTIAYVADSDSGLLVIDISNPLTPVQIGTLDVYGKIADVATSVFIAQYYDGLVQINTDNPELPYIEGSFETPYFGHEFFLRDGFAYGPTNQFDVINALDPGAPFRVGSTDEGGGFYIDVVDTFAYVSGTDSIFRIFNIADPASPFLTGSVGDAGYSYAVASDGDYTYTPTWHDGLVVINTSDKVNPSIEANHMDYSRRGYLELVGDLLFMEHLLILNVSDPFNPFEVGEWLTCCATDDIEIVDTLAFLASGDSEIMMGRMNIVNIADPENPTYVGGYHTSNEAHGVAAEGNIACVTDGVTLFVLDVSDPVNPLLLASGGVLGIFDVEMEGNYIYLSGSFGFYVFQYTTVCGDANDDCTVNIGDAVFIIQYVFAGGPPPPWICKADANYDGIPDIGDAVYLINHIFRSGPPPIETCCD